MKISKSTKIVEFDDDSEIEILRKRVLDEAPERGSQNYSLESLTFEMLPLSKRTQHGLKEAKIIIPTEIQAASIPHALSGIYQHQYKYW
jgi:superfamily II DNA/RNA helicase